MKHLTRFITLMVVLALTMNSCSKSSSGDQDPEVCDSTPKSFSANVNPLIQTFCNQANCHATGSTNGPGPLTNYTQVFNARAAIRSAVQSGLMPQNTTLSTAQKNTIICWIDGGGKND